jgi:hypothetical protein
MKPQVNLGASMDLDHGCDNCAAGVEMLRIARQMDFSHPVSQQISWILCYMLLPDGCCQKIVHNKRYTKLISMSLIFIQYIDESNPQIFLPWLFWRYEGKAECRTASAYLGAKSSKITIARRMFSRLIWFSWGLIEFLCFLIEQTKIITTNMSWLGTQKNALVNRFRRRSLLISCIEEIPNSTHLLMCEVFRIGREYESSPSWLNKFWWIIIWNEW